MEAASGSLFCFVNTNEITKMLFSFFPNYHSLSILNTVFSFFSTNILTLQPKMSRVALCTR